MVALACGWLLMLAPGAAAAEELPVTSGFDWRVHPVSGDWKFHVGVDLGYGYEAGYFLLSQLEEIAKHNRYGLGVERDLHAHGTVKELM